LSLDIGLECIDGVQGYKNSSPMLVVYRLKSTQGKVCTGQRKIVTKWSKRNHQFTTERRSKSNPKIASLVIRCSHWTVVPGMQH